MASCQHGIKKLFHFFFPLSPLSSGVKGWVCGVGKKFSLKHALTFFSSTLHTKFKRGFIHALERLNMKTRDLG